VSSEIKQSKPGKKKSPERNNEIYLPISLDKIKYGH
jgi:hypothetical protein